MGAPVFIALMEAYVPEKLKGGKRRKRNLCMTPMGPEATFKGSVLLVGRLSSPQFRGDMYSSRTMAAAVTLMGAAAAVMTKAEAAVAAAAAVTAAVTAAVMMATTPTAGAAV
jgi:hypothetical protein